MNRSGMIPSSSGPSTSSGMQSAISSSSNSQGDSRNNPGGNNVTKVAEVFLTAGHAFQRLGDLTLQLQGEIGDNDDAKWCEADITKLRDSLTRFAHELDTISESVQQRTQKHIKVDIKRRTLVGDDSLRRGASPAIGMGGGIGGNGGGIGSKRGPSHLMTMPPSGLAAKRIATNAANNYNKQYMGSSLSSGRLTNTATRPPTSYLTESSVSSGPPTLTPLATPLLSEPSHHYINTRSGSNF